MTLATLTAAETANFDGFAEGSLGQSFQDGGIQFYDPDAYGLPGVFVVEWASETLNDPDFSPPNALTMTGYSPGPQAAYSRVGTFRMKTGNVASSAKVQLFVFDNSTNKINLEATLGGNVVAETFVHQQGVQGPRHYTLELSDVAFDELRLYGSGDYQNGAFFGMMDNVEIGGGETCTGQERLKASCRGAKLKAKLTRAEPGSTATFRLDEDPDTDVRGSVNRSGKSKAKFNNVAPGRHKVEMLECDVDAETTCP
ncbi:MAG: hypothetical protein C4547_10650 [Phycisphaerales bacterium]|nr:MAG: hypothetical protein C4547_10650 [Phycisphaerales bacterium]